MVVSSQQQIQKTEGNIQTSYVSPVELFNENMYFLRGVYRRDALGASLPFADDILGDWLSKVSTLDSTGKLIVPSIFNRVETGGAESVEEEVTVTETVAKWLDTTNVGYATTPFINIYGALFDFSVKLVYTEKSTDLNILSSSSTSPICRLRDLDTIVSDPYNATEIAFTFPTDAIDGDLYEIEVNRTSTTSISAKRTNITAGTATETVTKAIGAGARYGFNEIGSRSTAFKSVDIMFDMYLKSGATTYIDAELKDNLNNSGTLTLTNKSLTFDRDYSYDEIVTINTTAVISERLVLGITAATSQLTFPDLTGVTITSSDGTATPTISGNNVIFSTGVDGYLSDLVLSDGTRLCCEGSWQDSGNNNHPTATDITITNVENDRTAGVETKLGKTGYATSEAYTIGATTYPALPYIPRLDDDSGWAIPTAGIPHITNEYFASTYNGLVCAPLKLTMPAGVEGDFFNRGDTALWNDLVRGADYDPANPHDWPLHMLVPSFLQSAWIGTKNRIFTVVSPNEYCYCDGTILWDAVAGQAYTFAEPFVHLNQGILCYGTTKTQDEVVGKIIPYTKKFDTPIDHCWILKTGVWDDAGIWVDTAVWVD